MTAKQVREEIESAMVEGGHLGDLVTWSIDVGDGVLPGEVEQALLENGLDTAHMPSLPLASAVFARVVREMDDVSFVQSAEDDAHALFKVWFDDECVNAVAYLKPSESLAFEHEDEDSARFMASLFARYKGRYNGNHIRRLVESFLVGGFGGVKMATGRMLYFVPTHSVDAVRRLARAVSRFGDSELCVLPVPGTPEAKRTVGQSVSVEIDARVSEYKDELDKWGDSARPATLERRLEQYRDARRLAEYLRDSLGQSCQEELEGIDRLTSRARSILGGGSENPEQEQSTEPPIFSALRVSALRALCEEHGIDHKGLKKNDMVKALESL